MNEKAQESFHLIDVAYAEQMDPRFNQFKTSLLQRAQDLEANVDARDVMIKMQRDWHNNYISDTVAMGLPEANKKLYGYVRTELHDLVEQGYRNANWAYGLAATSVTWGNLFN